MVQIACRQKFFFILICVTAMSIELANAQQGDPILTEVYTPVPPVVIPGKTNSDPPSDAIILFDGKNLDQWESVNDSTKPANWKVADNIVTVEKMQGNIRTKQSFL